MLLEFITGHLSAFSASFDTDLPGNCSYESTFVQLLQHRCLGGEG